MTTSDGLLASTQTDDRAVALRALRDYLATSLDDMPPARERAPLAARLVEVLAQIESLPSKREVSAADEIAARRASRRTGSAGKTRTKRSS